MGERASPSIRAAFEDRWGVSAGRARVADAGAWMAEMVASSADAIVSLARDGTLLSWNRAAEALYGYTAEEAVGQHVRLLAAPGVLPDPDATLARVAAGERILNFETVRRCKDGALVAVSADIYPVRGEDGEVSVMMCIVRHLAPQREAERALRHSEQRLGLALRAGRMGIWEWDLAAERIYWSPECTAIIGPAPEGLGASREGFFARVHPEDRAWVRARVQAALRGAQDYDADFRYYHADGRLLWLRNMAVVVRDAHGAPVRLVGTVQDVTERKQRDESVRESESRFRRAVLAAPFPAMIYAEDGEVLAISDALVAITGYRREEIATIDAWAERAYGLRAAEMRAVIHRNFEESAVGYAGEVEIRTADGRIRIWERGSAMLGRTADGRRLCISIAADVTRRKELAVELERAKEGAERANRAKDDFIALVSHELRTPLTAMLGWARMIGHVGVKPEVVAEGIRVIERNARAQAQLVEDLLDVSRIISGKLDVRARPMDLAAIVEAAAAAARPAADAKGVALTVALAPGAGDLAGDPERLSQVVVNLLGNAVKFTPPGGAVLASVAAEGDHAVLRVTDTGKGLAPELLPHVFDRFWQADVSSSRRHGGLGLGLAIVRQVVDLHGGTVEVHSAGEGTGTTFTVRLPRRLPADDDAPDERAAPAADAGALAGVHVLVVDDEADVRGFVQVVLESAGAQVTAVDSVAGALAVIEGSPAGAPSLVLSDLAMPGEDGYALLHRLHAAGPGLPVAALTAHARVEDRARALGAGFQRYLPKPVDPRELIAVVASLAGRSTA